MSFQWWCVHLQRRKCASMKERTPADILSVKNINYLKLSVNEHMNMTHFCDFSKTFGTSSILEFAGFSYIYIYIYVYIYTYIYSTCPALIPASPPHAHAPLHLSVHTPVRGHASERVCIFLPCFPWSDLHRVRQSHQISVKVGFFSYCE